MTIMMYIMTIVMVVCGFLHGKIARQNGRNCARTPISLSLYTPGDNHECDNPQDCECDNYKYDEFIVIGLRINGLNVLTEHFNLSIWID